MTRRWMASAALALAAASCGPSGPPPAIPKEMAACVPPGAILLAGARLDSLRASPLYGRLPPSAQTFLEPFRDASALMAVFNGTDLLLVARGPFRRPPPGATLVKPDLMLSGSQALVEAALSQRRTGAPGSPDLLAQASGAAKDHALWIAVRGNTTLPLSGDAANLNRILRLADFATLALRLDPPARLDLAAQSPTPESAQRLEESLRAFVSLAVIGVKRQPQLAAMLRAIEVRRDGREVKASIGAPPGELPGLFDLFQR